MGKKIVVISSSPRKGGNSDSLCNEFVRAAKEAGNDAEKIFLGDKTINVCHGCEACASLHKCIQRDDMAGILDKLVAADVIVLATPVYFYSMSAQMKTFIDRTLPRYTELSDKDFYFILTAADTDKKNLDRALESLRGFTDGCLTNPHEKGVIVASGVWKPGEIYGREEMKQAAQMGKDA